MGIEAGCVILWCKNTGKKGGLLAQTGFSRPSLTTYAIEQTLQRSQLPNGLVSVMSQGWPASL